MTLGERERQLKNKVQQLIDEAADLGFTPKNFDQLEFYNRYSSLQEGFVAVQIPPTSLIETRRLRRTLKQ